MTKKAFVKLIFRGPRFHDAAMPLEALPELAAYRDLVLAVAKALFQESNPTRQRLPKGFEASFRLVLEGLRGGSVVPMVSRLTGDEPALFYLATAPDFFEAARDLVEQGIVAAAKGDPAPRQLTKDVLARFNAFGRTLTGDDSILLASPDREEGAVYDRGVRRNLVLQAQASYEDAVTLLGEVRAADKDTEGYVLRTPDGQKIAVHIPPLFFPLALHSLGESVLVRVRGTGLFDAEGSLQKVTLATDVSLAEEGDEPSSRPGCSISLDTQLQSLEALAPDWYDETSSAYEHATVGWLSKLLKGLLDGFQLPTPYIYPTPDGLARAEWPTPAWEIVANIDPAARVADVIAARLESDEIHELSVGFSEPGAESKLGRFLVEHLQAR